MNRPLLMLGLCGWWVIGAACGDDGESAVAPAPVEAPASVREEEGPPDPPPVAEPTGEEALAPVEAPGVEPPDEEGSAPGEELEAGGLAGAGTDPLAGPELVEREGLRVEELVLARGVEERQPVDPGTTFSRADDERVYCYVKLDNPERIETDVHIGWERIDPPTEDLGRATHVRAMPRWVTFAYTGTRRRAGRYRCVVRDADGELLARAAFDLVD